MPLTPLQRAISTGVTFHVGDHVMAPYKGSHKKYPGVICYLEQDVCSIKFDNSSYDGNVEYNQLFFIDQTPVNVPASPPRQYHVYYPPIGP